MDRSLPIYASTASRRGHGRGWSRRRRRWTGVLRPVAIGMSVGVIALLATAAERLGG